MKTTISFSLAFLFVAAASAAETVSGDAFARSDQTGRRWTLGTAMVEQRTEFTGGRFRLVSFRNKAAQKEYAPQDSEEFRVSVDGAMLTGTEGNWTWKGGEARVLPQGEIQLAVRLENTLLAVEKDYVIYPDTGILRQWIRYQNRAGRSVTVSNPYFMTRRMRSEVSEPLRLYYMTGGGYYTGSQILKQVTFSTSYARTFDTTDQAETAEIAGVKYGGLNLKYGSGAYMPWFAVTCHGESDGLYLGLDYYGRWAAEIGNYHGEAGYLGLRLGGYEKQLAPGEIIETPKAFTGVFTGDLDSMGNQLKDWQYRYLWDYTNDEYFAKIRMTAEMRWQLGKGSVAWGGGTQDNWDYRLASQMRAIDVMRYAGADILWQDAGWHDHLGDDDGPDFSETNRYLRKHDMRLAIWWPLYSIAKQSRVYREHPDWRSEEPGIGGAHLDTSKTAVIEHLSAKLHEKTQKWGDFQWRLDDTPVVPVNKSETPMLDQYHNMMALKRNFRERHPHSSIDVCAGGGNLMGFEALRISDVSQLTDGGSLYIGNYYSSYLFPPDKIDDWTRNANFTWENARFTLTMAPAWMSDRGLYGHEPGLLLNNGLENLRRNFEIYRYLVKQGVAGRWSHVYHPRVEGDDPVYYFERLSRDSRRGIVILKRFKNGEVTIYPKALLPGTSYDVRFEMAKAAHSRTGADLMENGIRLVSPQPGELIYLGLPDHPGSGRDHAPPSDPPKVTKKVGNNLGITGIEIAWLPSTDNNWLSHYEIYRDDRLIGKVSTGAYYFDYSAGAGNIGSKYHVQAVDGDGNSSRKVEAVSAAGGPEIFTARGGYLTGKDYSYQGGKGWSYEEWSGAARNKMTWNGALAQMGLYQGASGTEKAVVGASWMRPGAIADAVRVFVFPHAGQVTVTATAHKDIYHTHGDGLLIRVLKNDEQVWPKSGWQAIAANDVQGVTMELKMAVRKGDRLAFVANCNIDPVDDDLVWNPRIAYDRNDTPAAPDERFVVDNNSARLKFAGTGWQKLGVTPWGGDLDQGYLPGRIRGSLSVSGTAGDRMLMKFEGTGIELIGDTGSDRGIARVILDGKSVGTIDTFVPENIITWQTAAPSRIRQARHLAMVPPTRLWGIGDLPPGEHTFELEVTGRSNPQSTGTFVGVDAVVILNGRALEPPM